MNISPMYNVKSQAIKKSKVSSAVTSYKGCAKNNLPFEFLFC